MPSTSRPLEGPSPSFGDTPPSTRPSSSASSASSGLHQAPPSRTLSMDSLSTSSGGVAAEKVEHIPTRTVVTGPKVNTKAMIFVKTGPAKLYMSATEQMKKAENIKNMRKVVQEEEEPEWQQNLDKWKQKRNRNNKDVLDRVLEVKKANVESEQNPRRKSSRVGLRNLIVHDDDNNDVSVLLHAGDNANNNNNITDDHTSINNSRNEPSRVSRITTTTGTTSSSSINGNRIQASTTRHTSLSSPPSSLTLHGGTTTIHAKDILLDHDNKDAKSDAGFCTGSDTGSDGVFPEDNISDTSSALGDKKETHDSLLDAAATSLSKDEDLPHSSSSAADGPSSGADLKDHEYTFDKAIEGYKQYAENSFKKRTSSMTSLTSVSSSSSRLEERSKYDTTFMGSTAAAAAAKSVKIEDKLDFFKKEMDKEFSKPPPKPIVAMREKSPKIDVTKRKSMFEAGQSISTINLSNIDINGQLDKRRSPDMTASTGNLRNKVASFENIDVDGKKQKVVNPPRDTKFKEKLANFSTKATLEETSVPLTRKKTPEKDKNFHQKLASFSKIENSGSGNENSRSYERRSSIPAELNNSVSLKSKIASFEQLDQHEQVTDFRLSDGGSKTREKSVSMECLSRSSASTRRLESRFSRCSVDRLDEEPSSDSPPSSWGRSSSSHQPRSPEKTSFESRFSSETRGYQSRSPDKRPSAFGGSSSNSSFIERRSQLEKSSVEKVTKSSEAPRSSRFSEGQQSFSKTFEESQTPRTGYSGGSSSVKAPLLEADGGPPEVPPLDLTNTQTEAPIGTSSPRTDSNSSSSLRPGTAGVTSSSSSQSVLMSFSSSAAMNFSSSFSTSSSSKISRRFAVDTCEEDDLHYDDVLHSTEPRSLASSSEGDRMRYTDDDINEVIQEAEVTGLPRGTVPSPTPRSKDVLETKTSFSSNQVSSSKVVQLPLGPPPSVPFAAPPSKPTAPFGFKSSSVLEPLPAIPVVFEDWADESGGSVAPPSEPPPPPPPDSSDAEDSDVAPCPSSPVRVGGHVPLSQEPLQRVGSPTPSDCPSLPLSEAYAGSDTSSKTSAKEELRKRRSDFLGTSRFSDDVASPPPDLDVLLRQQREADKQMLEARKSLTQSTHQVMSSIDSRHQALSAANSMDSTAGGLAGRDRYTWQDRLRADSSQPTAALDDTDDGYDYQNVTSATMTSTYNTCATSTSTSDTSASMTSTSDTSAVTISTLDPVGPLSGDRVILSDVLRNTHTDSSLTTLQSSSLVTGQTNMSAGDLSRTTPSLLQGGGGSPSVDVAPTLSHNVAPEELTSHNIAPEEQTSPDKGIVASDPNSLANTDSDLTIATEAPSDAIKGTSTVLDSSPFDILPESSTVAPSQLPAGVTVPTAQGSSDPEEPKKLAELEAEMLRHDRSVISRTLSQQQQQGSVPPSADPSDSATVTYDDVLAPADGYGYQDGGDETRHQTALDTSVTSGSTDDYYEQHRQKQLKQQFIQQQQHHQQVTEATYQNEEFYQQQLQQQQQQLVGDLGYSGADYYQQHREQQQQQFPVETGPEKPLRTYNPCYDSSAPVLPEPLPRKKKPPPPPEEERYESVNTSSSDQQQQFLSKQSRIALSAIPRSRITDGESWIKRKPEANKDYNKHWLYQEAEQRRLEQRDTRNSLKKDQKVPQQQHQQLNNHPSAPYSSASISSYSSSSNISRVESRSTDALQRSSSSDFGGLNRALDPHGRTASVDHALNRGPPVLESHTNRLPQEAPVNRNNDPNAWRNRAMTYQPLPPGGHSPQVAGSADKPLPDSIINTLTQRVNNKSRPGSASNSSGRPSPHSTGTSTSGYGTIGYSNDENYHDYMNADAISNMQQQQQQQSSHYHQTYYAPQQQLQMDTSEPPHHQQLYSTNSYLVSQSSMNNNNNNSNGSHEHYAQHLQVSPSASLPLSSSSSTISTRQQQHYSNLQHSYPNHNNSPKSPQSSPPSAKVVPPPSSSITPPTAPIQNTLEERQRLLSVSGKKKCSHCHKELGRGAAMIIESLRLYYHIPCFVCCVCGVQLSNGKKGADVNVRNHGVHCRNCYSNDQGVKFSEV